MNFDLEFNLCSLVGSVAQPQELRTLARILGCAFARAVDVSPFDSSCYCPWVADPAWPGPFLTASSSTLRGTSTSAFGMLDLLSSNANLHSASCIRQSFVLRERVVLMSREQSRRLISAEVA